MAQSDSASWLGGAGDEEWDGKGEVMPLEGDAQRGLFGIGATLVRDSRGLFFVAETHSTRPHEATSLVQDLRVGDIIVEVDGIQVPPAPPIHVIPGIGFQFFLSVFALFSGLPLLIALGLGLVRSPPVRSFLLDNQTTGKSAEAVESLLLGPLHSPVKLLLAQVSPS